MPTVDFYKNLGYDFYQYEDEEELRGLTPGGFNGGDAPLNVKDFNGLPDFVIVSPKNLHQRVWRFSDVLPSALFGCKPPCSEVV